MIALYTDDHFLSGKAHMRGGKPCQDYALSETRDSAALALVTDGCSTGGNTDIGARLLAFGIRTAVREHWTIHRNPLETMAAAKIELQERIITAGTRETLGLSREDMLATCVYAYFSPKGGFVRTLGDGVVAWKDRSGRIHMLRYEWMRNMPFYQAYLQSAEDQKAFIDAHGGDLNAPAVWEDHWVSTPGENPTHCGTTELPLSAGMQGMTLRFSEKDIEEFALLAVFSDGVTQVKNTDWKNAIHELLAFKNTEGEFAKRRMIRFAKDAEKTGNEPIDDIAYAVIRREPDTTNPKEN